MCASDGYADVEDTAVGREDQNAAVPVENPVATVEDHNMYPPPFKIIVTPCGMSYRRSYCPCVRKTIPRPQSPWCNVCGLISSRDPVSSRVPDSIGPRRVWAGERGEDDLAESNGGWGLRRCTRPCHSRPALRDTFSLSHAHLKAEMAVQTTEKKAGR